VTSVSIGSLENLCPLVGSKEDLNCKLNAISVEELFKRDFEIRVLYSAEFEKKYRLVQR
jgi:hypothetical protein